MNKLLAPCLRSVLLAAALLIAVQGASAQAASQILNQIIGTGGTPGAANTTSGSADPLGRSTPRGTVFGFLQSAQLGRYDTAAQYLQLNAAQRRTQGQALAQELLDVINRGFSGSVNRISNQPGGVEEVGVPRDHEQVGMLSLGDVDVPLDLVHVTDSDGDKIWLVSSDTVSKLPELHSQAQIHQLETHLPPALVKFQILGMPAWQWLALLLLVPVALGGAWFLIRLALLSIWAVERLRKQQVKVQLRDMSSPLLILLATTLHLIGVRYLVLPLLIRAYYGRVILTLLIVAFFWLCARLLRRAMRAAEQRAIATGRAGIGSLLLLGQRIANAVLILAAILAIFRALGFDMSTALAGVGIGGIAIALGAQKSLENLIGGIAVLSDDVIRVGDACRFGDKSGVIEDISLRSTRIRTGERTELSIPNGALATMNVENLTRRDKILFDGKLGLRYETTADQLRAVLAEIRRMFYEHPKVEQQSAWIRFAGFEDHALRLAFSSYLLTTNDAEALAIREDLLLRILEIVKSAGTGFALPSRTVYVTGDSGLDAAKTAEIEQKVREWRQHNQLPFPDFNPNEIPGLRDQIVYPAPESAVRATDSAARAEEKKGGS